MPPAKWSERLSAHRFEFAFLAILFAAAFAVRVWQISTVHFWDEAVYLQNAEVILGLKHNYSELSSRPPLLSLIFAAVLLVWHHIYAAVIATALMNAAAPVLLYLAGRRIVGRPGAVVASLLLGFAPFFVGAFPDSFPSDSTGNSLLSDCPALTLILLAFWLLLRALERPGNRRFLLVGLVFATAVLMRFASLSSVFILGLLIFSTPQYWRAALRCGAGFLLGMAPYLCWSKWHYGDFLATMRQGYVDYRGERQPVSFYLANFGTMFCWITLAGILLWVARWVWRRSRHSEWPHARAEQGSLEPFLWIWTALAIAFFFGMRHQEPRYLIPAAPPMFLLAGSGLATAFETSKTSRRLPAGAALGLILVFSFLPSFQRLREPLFDTSSSEEMEVIDYLQHSFPSTTILYSNFNYPVFAYYSNFEIHVLPTFAPAVYTALGNLPVDGILIAYKPEIHPDPTPEWLAANPHFTLIREFPSLRVYRFQRGN